MKYMCPCCFCFTFDEPRSSAIGDICPVCYWEIDPFTRTSDDPSGANHGLTLNECRANFSQFGACTEKMAQYTREPLPDELKKYIKTEVTGGCYDEFVRGRWDGSSHWNTDSLYLYDDAFDELGLYENVFSKVFELYDRWGSNRVTREIWARLYSLAENHGGEIKTLFDELAPWVEENFAEYDEFWIIGV
ncbi:MAG: hypothetical protein K2N38_10790 [Oscillospiraceae bacterium]|nr:hypothetical protein [Oscillospiraceae bacterium]